MLTKMELLNLGGIICNMLQTERSQIHEHPNPGASPFPELGETTLRGGGCWMPLLLGPTHPRQLGDCRPTETPL